MGYGIFSLISAVITFIAMVVIGKGKLQIIAGYDSQNTQANKALLKSSVVRMLLSVTVIQLTTGVICFFKINGPILITSVCFLIFTCLIGILLYSLAEKTKRKSYEIAHRIFSWIVMLSSPIIISCIAFLLI